MVAFNNDFSYAKGAFLVVAPVVVFLTLLPKILNAFASNSADRTAKDATASSEKFTFNERKITLGQNFSGTGQKVANILHPFRQSKKSASSGASDRSIMTRLWSRMSYKAAR